MKKIGIIGTRRRNTRTDYMEVLNVFLSVYEDGDWIVSGGCTKGGDAFAEKIAHDFGIPILIFEARWNHKWKNGKFIRLQYRNKAAGKVRNVPIAEHSDIIIACVATDRQGGTEHTISKFKSLGKGGALLLV